jgi:hypothetical protein
VHAGQHVGLGHGSRRVDEGAGSDAARAAIAQVPRSTYPRTLAWPLLCTTSISPNWFGPDRR